MQTSTGMQRDSAHGITLKHSSKSSHGWIPIFVSIKIIAQKESCWIFVVRYRATPVPCKCPIILSTTPASFSHPIAAVDHSSHSPDHHLIVLLLDPNTNVLNLETARASSATSTLELAALGDNVGFLVFVGTHAEVLDSLTGVLGSTQDQSVAASGGAQSKLIQSDGLAASLDDASTSSSGESQSGNVDLGEGQQAVVIGDGADNDDGTLLALLVDVPDDAG